MNHSPERRAWRILLSGFFVFLLLCGSVIYVVQWFVFQSQIDMTILLTSARGTASLILPNTGEPIAVTDRRDDLEPGVVILTDSNSQASLTFVDPRSQDIIASLTLFPDSRVSIEEARSPRFGPNKSPYHILIHNSKGHVELLLLQIEREVELEVTSSQTLTQISQEGLYIFKAAEQSTIITTWMGQAAVIHQGSGEQVLLDGPAQVIASREEDELLELEPEISLLENPYFQEAYEQGWSFYNDREPPGTASNAITAGRPVVVIDRSQGNWPNTSLGHGETGLVQFLNLDVSEYDYLELRATFYVDEQSLSTCGVAGSECPMMVRMVYRDEEGTERVFIQGFYAAHQPELELPLQCATCRSPHQRINGHSWFTFESGNLMTLLPDEQRPVELLQISFYASGHAYKIYVSEVNLLAAE